MDRAKADEEFGFVNQPEALNIVGWSHRVGITMYRHAGTHHDKTGKLGITHNSFQSSPRRGRASAHRGSETAHGIRGPKRGLLQRP